MNTALGNALKVAASKKTSKTETGTKVPLISLSVGEWLKGPMVQALRGKYGMDTEAGQRGADYLISSGMVQIPADTKLICVGIRRFGGALGFVCGAKGDIRGAKPTIEGLPD